MTCPTAMILHIKDNRLDAILKRNDILVAHLNWLHILQHFLPPAHNTLS